MKCNRRTKTGGGRGEELTHQREEYSQSKTERITCLFSERDKEVTSFVCMEK